MSWSATAAKLLVGCLATQWSPSIALHETKQVDNSQADSLRRLRGPMRGQISNNHRHSAGEISRARDSGTLDIANPVDRDSGAGLASQLGELTQSQPQKSKQNPQQDSIFVCRQVTLDFAKAANGRVMWGGEFVRDDWFYGFGVSIDAEGHDDKNNVHPMIFDSAEVESNGLGSGSHALGSPNHDCEGFGEGIGGKIGKTGENCKSLGNLLIPTPKPEYKNSHTTPQGGVLVFEFHKHTKVEHIGLLNLGSMDQIMIVHNDGSTEKINLFSVGQNGYQNINLDMENVQKMHITLHSFGAVTGLDLCIA